MITRLFNRFRPVFTLYPQAAFSVTQAATQKPHQSLYNSDQALEEIVNPLEFSPKSSAAYLQKIIEAKGPLNIPLLEGLLTTISRYYTPKKLDKKACTALALKITPTVKPGERKPMIRVLVTLAKALDNNKVVINHLLKVIEKDGKLDHTLFLELSNNDLVDLVSILSFLEDPAQTHALKVLDYLLCKPNLEPHVVDQVLYLPLDLLRKVDKKLENVILSTPIRNLSFTEKLGIIDRLAEVYQEYIAVDVVEKYFESAFSELKVKDRKTIPELQAFLKSLRLLQKKAPHYFYRKSFRYEIVNTFRVIMDSLRKSNAPLQLEVAFRNTIKSYHPKADFYFRTLDKVQEDPTRLNESTLITLVEDLLKYLKESNYIFDFFALNRFYTANLQGIMEVRALRIKCLYEVLRSTIAVPDKYKNILIYLLSHPCTGKVLEMATPQEIAEVAKFVQNYAEASKDISLEKSSALLSLVKNCPLAKPESLPPPTLVKLILDSQSEENIKEFYDIFSKYVSIVFSPCVDGQAYYENIRKELEKSKLIQLLDCMHLEKGAPFANLEENKDLIQYLIPAYYYLADVESTKRFVKSLVEIPPPILSALDSEELRQLLLIHIKAKEKTLQTVLVSALRTLPIILQKPSCTFSEEFVAGAGELRGDMEKLLDEYNKDMMSILNAYLDNLHEMPRSYLDSEAVIAIGYIAVPFASKLTIQQLLKLLKILGSDKIVNYPPDLINYLAKYSDTILSNAAKESPRIQLELYKHWPNIFSGKLIKQFALSLSKTTLDLFEKPELLTAAAYKKVFLPGLLNDIIARMKRHPSLFSQDHITSLLSGLSYLGVELGKNDLITLNTSMKAVLGGPSAIKPEILIDFLFLTIQSPTSEILKAIPDVKTYVEIISKWSPKRILLDPKKPDYENSYTQKTVSDRIINKTKFQLEHLNVLPDLMNKMTNENGGEVRKPRRKKNIYEIMATETRQSEDVGFQSYANAMALGTTSYSTAKMHLIEHIYDDFELAKEKVIKQWAILLEHNVPPKDKELYTYCNTLLRRKAGELPQEFDIAKICEAMTRTTPDLPKRPVACPSTGWILDVINKKDTTSKRVGKLLMAKDFYTEIDTTGKHTEKLLGCEKVIARQLSTLSNYKVRQYYKTQGRVMEYNTPSPSNKEETISN